MTPEPAPSRRPKLIGAAALAVTLVAGILAGAAADRVLGHPGEERQRGPCGGRSGHELAVFDALDLTADQRARVEVVLERRRGQMDLLWQETRPRMRALVDSTTTEIRRVLSPEQRDEFDRMREEGAKLGLKRRHGWGPPGEWRRAPRSQRAPDGGTESR